MSETKTKKALFGLFLIPLAGLFSLFLSTVNTVPTSAAVCKDSYSYSLSDDGKTITEKHTGQVEQNAGTSFSSCANVNETTKFTEKDGSLVYSDNKYGKCGNQITLSAAPVAGKPASGKYQGFSSGTCSPSNYNRAVSSVAVSKNYVGTAGSDITNTADKTKDATNCSISGIGWLLCPVIDFGSNIADAALGFLSSSFLETNTDLYSTDSATYSAWQWILGFANVIFVVIFLIIIFSQATGFGISNYGIKKMLPKLIIGVVLINLSFFICQLLVDLSNLLGYGFNKFFESLAGQIAVPNKDDPFATGNPFGGIATGILTVVAVGFAIYAALAFFIPVLVAAIIGLLMIFLFLVARQALIVLGIIIAPLAFAAWLLPNTEKLFKRWWSIFIQLLLLFPIIGLVYGASKLVSRIIASVYSGDGAGNISGNLAEASTIHTSNGGNLVGQIIAAAVLVVPLFAVPFLLKGAISGIPVVGKLASKAYGNATNGARKRTGAMTDPMFAGLRAQQRAGLRGWGGRNRAQRDAHGNVMYDKEGNILGKNGKPLTRTASQWLNETKKSFQDNEKSFEKLADAQYDRRALNKPGSLAGRAHARNERTGLYEGLTKQGLETEFQEERANDPSLQTLDQRTQALAQASKNAQTYRLGQFANSLQEDPELLSVAAGTVDSTRGQQVAKSFAVQAQRSAQSENVKANMVLTSDIVRRKTAEASARGDINPASGRAYTDLDFLEQEFNDAVDAKDTDRLRAVSTLMLRQGSSGYDRLDSVIKDSKNLATFNANPEMSRDYRGYMVDEHAKDLKVRQRTALQFMFTGKVTNPAALGQYRPDGTVNPEYNVDVTNEVQAYYGGLTPEETASQTPKSMAMGVASGGIDLTSAQAVLLEDGLVQKMTTAQMDELVNAVQIAANHPGNEQVDIDRREAAKVTAEIIRKADTFPRFDASIKRRIAELSGVPVDTKTTGGEPEPGPSSSGTSTDSGPLTDDDKGGIGDD